MPTTTPTIAAELNRRHRATALTLNALLVLTVVLAGVAFVGHDLLYRPGSPNTVFGLRIAILMFAIGAIVLRRTRFQAARLQDIAGLRGISGLLATLQNTTLQVACLALAIALMGFIGTILTNEPWEMLRATAIAIVLYIYCYPKKRAWERVVHGIETAGDANDSSMRGVNP
jgi:hypothetical protein